jgi:hypothetical protein
MGELHGYLGKRVAEDTRPGPWLAAPNFVLQDKT